MVELRLHRRFHHCINRVGRQARLARLGIGIDAFYCQRAIAQAQCMRTNLVLKDARLHTNRIGRHLSRANAQRLKTIWVSQQ